jgi:hypothetical protein
LRTPILFARIVQKRIDILQAGVWGTMEQKTGFRIVIGAPACEYEALLSGRPAQARTADAVDGAKLG